MVKFCGHPFFHYLKYDLENFDIGSKSDQNGIGRAVCLISSPPNKLSPFWDELGYSIQWAEITGDAREIAWFKYGRRNIVMYISHSLKSWYLQTIQNVHSNQYMHFYVQVHLLASYLQNCNLNINIVMGTNYFLSSMMARYFTQTKYD